MSDPIKRLGRRLVTGGEELPEEVTVPAADLAALLAEVARLREWLQAMQTLSAVSDVVRGDPQASLKSGAALALLHEMTREGEPAYEGVDGVLRAESKPWWNEAAAERRRRLTPQGAEWWTDETQEAPGRREGEPGAEEG